MALPPEGSKRRGSDELSSPPLGRPSKFDEKYCEELIKHCSQGLSFESFAGQVGIGRTTLYRWLEDNDSFRHAKDIAMEACRVWWEKAGLVGMTDPSFKAPVWIYSMKCRFKNEWTETKNIELSGKVESTSEDLKKELQGLKDMLKEEIEG